ncbi:MAG: alpha/beta hydrolase [Actinomycetota bacterium]|nr:alpha/beta hydrolase [Actinomycetota bacterium]
MTVKEQIEGGFFRGVMNLPEQAQRVLAGRPVRRDGLTLATETQLMLRLQTLVREPKVEELPLPRARATLVRQARIVGGELPIGETRDLTVDGAEGPLRARLYAPSATLSAPASPLLMFIHGGGMMYGDIESHDAPCRFLAEQAGVRVLSVDYRLAPENQFPVAVEDCAAAYRWVVAHAEELGAEPSRLAVGGDSAGGYLSATTAVTAAEEGLPLAFQLLIYPATDFTKESESRRLFAEGFYLNKRFMDGAKSAYYPPGTDLFDPQASVLMRQKFPDGLAPAYVVTAGFDPLRDEGEAYAALLGEHGVEVEARRFPDLIHGFLNVVGCGRAARAANAEIAAKLKQALDAG